MKIGHLNFSSGGDIYGHVSWYIDSEFLLISQIDRFVSCLPQLYLLHNFLGLTFSTGLDIFVSARDSQTLGP